MICIYVYKGDAPNKTKSSQNKSCRDSTFIIPKEAILQITLHCELPGRSPRQRPSIHLPHPPARRMQTWGMLSVALGSILSPPPWVQTQGAASLPCGSWFLCYFQRWNLKSDYYWFRLALFSLTQSVHYLWSCTLNFILSVDLLSSETIDSRVWIMDSYASGIIDGSFALLNLYLLN